MPFRPPSTPIRVLHIDDDEWQLSMLRDLLKTFDSEIEIDSLSNPLETLDKLKNKQYDCLIVDYKMPELNGIELARKIRKENTIPIIIYTGQGTEEVAEEAFSVGINDFFRKETAPQHYQVIAKRIRDIVEKQRIEKVYNNIVKDAKDAIAIIVKGNFVFVNEAFLRLIGASSEKDILGKNSLNLLTGIEKKTVQEEMTSLLEGKKTHILTELEIKRRFRKKIPVEINTSVIDYLGQKALLFFFRDITDRKALETKIKNSEMKYRSLVELAPDGIVTINLRGDVTWINEAYASITGYTPDEIIGKKVWALKTVRPTDIGIFLGLFVDLLRGRSIPAIEFQWLSKDGSHGWGEGRASLIKIDNKSTEVLLSLRDITDRKRMEEDLRRYSKDMELLAEERAEKLLESEKLIVAGTIASTVAHDLKGPLNTIMNAVYLMDAKPEKSAEMKAMILKAVDNASRMLNDVRSKTVSEVLNIEKVDVATFIESIIRETPIPPHIEVKTDLEHQTVEIDRLKMRRVIENLIRNAIEAMTTNGTLLISARIEEDKAVIEVKDFGVGIPEDKLRNLFTPFHTTKENGTGLGLIYCKKTIEDHGGDIEVRSKVGFGTTIILRIPIKRKIFKVAVTPINRH